MDAKMQKNIAIVAAAAGSLLAVTAGAVYLGYLPTSEVSNLTSGELGSFSALLFVVAIVFYFA